MFTSKMMASRFVCLIGILTLLSAIVIPAYATETYSDDTFLAQTGMPEETINDLDKEIKQYIVESLNAQNFTQPIQYIGAETVNESTPISIKSLYTNIEKLNNIKFTVQSFRSGDNISIYPTYEFLDDKKPVGKDTVAIQFGDAQRMNSYGGKLWFKDSTMSNWEMESTDHLSPTSVSLYGAEYSGKQLGSPGWKMKLKGCLYAIGTIGSGTDKRMSINYVYNPSSKNISISIGAFGISIGTSSLFGSIYSTGQTMNLSY